jgi:hypothetical protein
MSAGQPLNLGLNGARAPSGSVCNCPRMPRGLGTWRARDEGLRTADLARVSQLDCDVCSSVRGGRWFLFQPTRAAYTLRPTTGSRSHRASRMSKPPEQPVSPRSCSRSTATTSH